MKFNKIFAIALAALTMTACSDDDNNLNTASGVTVDFEGATMEVNEDQEFFEIPVMVTGETNGDVKVTIEVEAPADPDDDTVAIENKEFIITSYTITIPQGTATGAFEVRNVWESGLVTPDKTFNVKITKVEGAEVGVISTSVVTIINIDDAFTSLFGRWTLTATNTKTGADVSYVVRLGLPSFIEDGEEGHLISAWGYQGDEDMFIPIWFDIDEYGNVDYVGIPLNYLTSNYYYNFGDAVGYALLCTASIVDGSWYMNGDIPGEINDDHTEITFDENYPLVNRLISYPSFSYLGYTYGTQLSGIKLTRN